MTELSFLLNLLLNHKLPKITKDLVAARIKEVESTLHMRSPRMTTPQMTPEQHALHNDPIRFLEEAGVTWKAPAGVRQAPSTLALMMKHGDLPSVNLPPSPPPPEPVAVIAQTPQTAAAMQSRHQAIAEAMAGKVDKVTGRPKKW